MQRRWPHFKIGDVLTVSRPGGRSYNFMVMDGQTYFRQTGQITAKFDAGHSHPVNGPSFFCEYHGVVEPVAKMICLYINTQLHTVCKSSATEVIKVAKSKGYKVEKA